MSVISSAPAGPCWASRSDSRVKPEMSAETIVPARWIHDVAGVVACPGDREAGDQRRECRGIAGRRVAGIHGYIMAAAEQDGRVGSLGTRSRRDLAVFASPPLRRLALSYGLFGLAESSTWIAVTVFAFARGGVAEAGVISVVQLVPGVVAAPFAAYAGDRFRRDIVLVAGYGVQAATCAAAGATMLLGAPVVVVYAATTSAAVAFTFTRPRSARCCRRPRRRRPS